MSFFFKKKSPRFYWTLGGMLLPCFLLLFALYYNRQTIIFPKKSEEKALESSYDKALKLYEQQDFVSLAKMIEPKIDDFLDFPEGCSLVVSVYAQLNKMVLLEAASNKCLKKEDSSGIAYEGLAASLSAQNRHEEAIQHLEQLAEKKYHDRLFLSLGQLYLLTKDFDKAHQVLLQLIKRSEMWSTWLIRIMSLKHLNQDQAFLSDLVDIVCTKKVYNQKVETILLEKISKLGFVKIAQKLENRIEKFSNLQS